MGIEIEIPVPADLEEILLELRQVAGAAQRRGVHEKRRLDLGIAMLTGVELEHEVDQRARQPRARADQHREPRAGHPRGALEIENPERGTEIPMRLRLEVEGPRLAVAAHFDVVGGARAARHAGVRNVRQRHHQRRALRLDLIGLDFELTDPLRARLVGGKDPGRVEPLALRPRDFVAGGVLFALQPFELRDQPAPARLERGELFELGVRIHATGSHGGADHVDLFTEQTRVEHGCQSYTAAPGAALSAPGHRAT